MKQFKQHFVISFFLLPGVWLTKKDAAVSNRHNILYIWVTFNYYLSQSFMKDSTVNSHSLNICKDIEGFIIISPFVIFTLF